MVAEAESVGVLQSGERRMITGVLRLGDRPVRGIMTPSTDVDWVDLTLPLPKSPSASLRPHTLACRSERVRQIF
jgi:CBS domain containing-hemolysin-like protein